MVETPTENTSFSDILELVQDDWAKLGIRAFTHPAGRDLFRQHILSGQTIMAISDGMDNGAPSESIEPDDLAPIHESQFQWSRWGQYFESDGHEGDPVDLPEVVKLVDLYRQWRRSTGSEEREAAWTQMLAINADQVFTIGIVNGTQQPVVIKDAMRNVPEKGLFGFEPSAYFGIYMPDTFWIAGARPGE